MVKAAAVKKEETALTVVEFAPPAMMDEEFGVMIQDELDGLTLDFTRVKIPSGGGLMFEIPGEDPDNPDVAKELAGVIVDHHPCNALWLEEFKGGNMPPDCSSLDGKIGIDKEGKQHVCATCKYNQWGTDPNGGNGKWCKNMRRLYMLQEEEIFPLLLTVPPTSLKNVADYVAKRVLTKKLRLCEVVTNVTLRKAASTDGITYSQVFFKMVGVLSPDARKAMKQFSANIKLITRRMALESDDYGTSDSIEDDDTIDISEADGLAFKQADDSFDIPGAGAKRVPKEPAVPEDPYFNSNPPF
jgi:hypothetical protein